MRTYINQKNYLGGRVSPHCAIENKYSSIASRGPSFVILLSHEDEGGYVAWIDNQKFKGMVVQSNSLKGVFEELFISLKLKFAYDYGINIGGVEEKIDTIMQQYNTKQKNFSNGKQEINLNFA